NYDPGEEEDFGLSSSNFDDAMVKSILKYQIDEKTDVADEIISALESSDPIFKLTLKAREDDPESKVEDEIEDAADNKGGKICNYFDLKMILSINKKESKNTVSETGDSIKIKIKVPDDEYKSYRSYNIVRYIKKADTAELLNSEFKTGQKVEFSTSHFSDYAIAYKGSSSSSSSSSAQTTAAAASSRSIASASTLAPETGTGADAADGGGTTGSKAPKTGDDFNARMWIFFLVVGIVVALCSFILFQDTKDYYEDKKDSNS
ncbi:MAG: hypothetical protein IJ641_01650, partial [Lachnospiraceae bacterium]|nr:hypothetical protein [Lachnospiraceae bacterium]